MKKKIYISRFLLTVITGLALTVYSFSQGIDIGSRKSGGTYLDFSVAPSQTRISNSFETANIKPEQASKISFSGKLEAGFLFSENFGISTGIGYNSFSSDLSLENYSATIRATDADNDDYERNIKGKNISERQKIGFVSLPVLLSLQFPFSRKSGIELQSGVNLNIPLSKKYSSEGVFDYSGYYSAYRIMFEDIPYETFSNNVSNRAEKELLLKSLIPELTGGCNLYIMMQEKVRLSAGLIYGKVLSNISGYHASDAFVLSDKPSEMKSFMEGSSKVTAQAVGFRVGIRYYMRR